MPEQLNSTYCIFFGYAPVYMVYLGDILLGKLKHA